MRDAAAPRGGGGGVVCLFLEADLFRPGGWLTPPNLLAYAATEKGVASGRAHELNPLLRTTGARAAAQLLQVGVASLVVHEVSKRNRSAGRWTLRVFVGYKWIEAGWNVHVAFSSSGRPRR